MATKRKNKEVELAVEHYSTMLYIHKANVCVNCPLKLYAEKDDKIVAITAAMPDGTGLKRFSSRYPDRFFDVGIAEEHAVTFAAGLAAGGLKPVVAIYSSFLADPDCF